LRLYLLAFCRLANHSSSPFFIINLWIPSPLRRNILRLFYLRQYFARFIFEAQYFTPFIFEAQYFAPFIFEAIFCAFYL